MAANPEPAITVASITAGATAVIGLLVAFGLPLTDDQTNAILLVVGVVAPVVVGFVARHFVTPSGEVVVQDDGSGPKATEASPLPTGTPVAVAPSGGVV